MKVGLLTTYRTICGISEYSGHLARALRRVGADVTVLGSRNYGHYALPAEEADGDLKVVPVFDVEVWSPQAQHELDVDAILAMELDVIHVQYEVLLYHRERLQQLLDRFKGLKVITWHDQLVPPDMPGPWDVQLQHRHDLSINGGVIPFGIENVPPLVKTFGLGRSRSDVICSICDAHGWRFEESFGDRRWLGQSELHAWLREADAIVLWYPDVPSAGSSQAARTALATRRPLIVNDVTWFDDLPMISPHLRKVADTPAALEAKLVETLDAPYLEANSWDHVAELHLAAYHGLIA